MLPHRLGMSCCAPQQNWRQSDQSVGLAKEDRIGHDQEAINPTLRKSLEGVGIFVSCSKIGFAQSEKTVRNKD